MASQYPLKGVISLEYLTSFKRDCDSFSSLLNNFYAERWNTWPHLKGIATRILFFLFYFFKYCWNTWPHLKGIATCLLGDFFPRSAILLEYLTSFKRDCDFSNKSFYSKSIPDCWNTWPHLKGIATFLLFRHTPVIWKSWNTWPHLKGIATKNHLGYLIVLLQVGILDLI